MKRPPWPDLAYRTRREPKSDGPGKAQSGSRPEPPKDENQSLKFGDTLIALINKVAQESGSIGPEMTEDEYVVHLKDCATCRRNVASFARMGMKIPSRILVAAGVEVLN